MRTATLLSVVALAGALMSCEKETPIPTADFTFRGTTDEVLTLAPYDTCSLLSHAPEAATVAWDFGNGTTSTAARPVLQYTQGGDYQVKLTVTGPDRVTRTVVRRVHVLDLLLKRIRINRTFWTRTSMPNFNATWPRTDSADLFVQVQLLTAQSTFPPGGFVGNAPVVYTSDTLRGVYRDTQTPLLLNVPQRLVLDQRKFRGAQTWTNTYLVSLMARNATGTYCLFNSMFGGASSEYVRTGQHYNFTTSLYSSVTLECQHE